jgi:UDP-N-acetylmuramyl pentapeptide synthase
MYLKDLIEHIHIKSRSGRLNVEISHIDYDSRKIGHGGLFVAMKGYTQNGHDFIEDAALNGAAADSVGNAPRHPYTKSRRTNRINCPYSFRFRTLAKHCQSWPWRFTNTLSVP